MNSTKNNNFDSGKKPKSTTKNPYEQTNGTSLPLAQNKRPETTHSPRPPPLISKYRGEPIVSPEGDSKPVLRASSSNTKKMEYKLRRAAPFFVIDPEWSSEWNSISNLEFDASSFNSMPSQNHVTAVRRSSHRRCQVIAPAHDENCSRGILPTDRGTEGVLSVARRAASCNPVWPHRCKSAPAQRAVNPITWV